MYARTLSKAEGCGCKLDDSNQDVESDFKLSGLITKLNNLATKILEVENSAKAKGGTCLIISKKGLGLIIINI